MRISIPSIPNRPSPADIARHAATAQFTVRQGADAIVQFLDRARSPSSLSPLASGSGSGLGLGWDAGSKGDDKGKGKGKERAGTGRTLIMTGAGVSVDSGIRAYRGEEGHYTVNKTYRPIIYHEFIDETEKGELASLWRIRPRRDPRPLPIARLLSNALLVVGSSLATYSAYRLVKQAVEERKPVLLLNVGPTRADALADIKLELGSSEVLELVAKTVCGSRAENDEVLRRLLTSGVTVPPAKAIAYSS